MRKYKIYTKKLHKNLHKVTQKLTQNFTQKFTLQCILHKLWRFQCKRFSPCQLDV